MVTGVEKGVYSVVGGVVIFTTSGYNLLIILKFYMSPMCKVNPELKSDTNLNSTNLLSVVFA